MLALLRAGGVDVQRVLVRPRHLVDLGDAPRVVDDYPESLLRVATEAGGLWLDLSGAWVPVGWLHPALRDAELVATEGAADLPSRTPAPSGRLPGLEAEFELVVGADGDAAGVLLLSLFQQSDELLREDLWSVPEADRLQVFEQWLAVAQPGIAVHSVQPVELDDPDQPVRLLLEIALPGLFAADADTLTAPGLLPDLLPAVDGQAPDLASLVLGGDRTAPLLVWPYHESLTVRLSGPGVRGRTIEGWEPIALRHPRAQVTRTRTQKGNRIELTRDATYRLGRVAPADYPELRDMLSAVVSSGRMPVRLVR